MIEETIDETANITNPPLIQFSPIRSGSTLVYNILREAFPEKKISKRHRIKRGDIKNKKIITTYRNPLDCLASSFKRYQLEPSDLNIKNQILELKNNGLDDLLEIFQDENILLLKYEDFFNDYGFVFDKLEIFFSENISQDTRQKIVTKFNVDEVVKVTSKYENFNQYDSSTHLHGNHISNSKGKPNSYIDFFNVKQIEFIQEELYDYIINFGYEETIYNKK